MFLNYFYLIAWSRGIANNASVRFYTDGWKVWQNTLSGQYVRLSIETAIIQSNKKGLNVKADMDLKIMNTILEMFNNPYGSQNYNIVVTYYQNNHIFTLH